MFYEFMYLAKGNVLYKQCKNCAGSSFLPAGLTANTVSVLIPPVAKPAKKSVPSTPLPKSTKMTKSISVHKSIPPDGLQKTYYVYSKKEFTEWSKTAREKRKLCEDGQISLKEFQAWLDESKCR